MSLTVQNLRAVGPGVEPASLLPGQLAFNITDKVLFVGDGSNFKTQFNGDQVVGTPGEGWYAMPMDFASLGDYYVANPGYYGDIPTDQQVLAWSTALNHPIWISGSGGGGSQVYIVTNAQVASASGATTSDKISAAIGVVSPDEGNVVIVTGLPDDVYEGLYFFTTEWVKGAAYAYPSASEVIYDNTVTGLTPTVQGAIDDLDAGLIATTAIANTANSTANSALSIASAALPRTGGTMTGTIVARNVDVQSGFNIQFLGSGGISFNAGSNGNITGISDAVTSTSSTLAASANALRFTYDLAAAAVPRSSFVSPGDLLVGTGAGVFSPLPAGAADYILASDGAGNLLWVPDSEGDVTSVAATAPITVDNTDPQVPVIGVDLATTATPGVVQIELTGNLTLVGGVINVPNASTTVKGAVQLNNTLSSTSTTLALAAAQGKALQDQIDSLTFANSVTLAGGYNATTGLVDGATSQGNIAGFFDGSTPPAPGPSNLDYYLICTTSGPLPSAMQNGDWLLSDGTQYVVLGVGARPQSASYTQAGIVQLADGAAVLAGTSDTLAITPQALQDNVIDSVTTANSSQIASATAVKTAYDAAVAAQNTATAALPKAGGTMTGNITFQDAGEGVTFSDLSSVIAISDSVSTASATTAASSNAAKTAYDAGIQGQTDAAAAQATADAALPKAGGTMTGNITFQDAGEGVVFSGGSSIIAISDATGNTNSDIAASSTAVKDAYALADAAVPKACYTALGALAAGTGASTVGTLALGTSGQFLSANSACGTGLEWCTLSLACVPCSAYTAVGTILAGNGAGTYCSLLVGTNGQVLVPNSACAAGVEWVTCQGVAVCGYTCTATPFNTALGALAGDSITTGVNNTSLGYNAGTAITGGLNNTFVGFDAGDGITSADNNVAVGSRALSNTGGNNNTVVGYCTAGCLTSGGSNTFIGGIAGYRATTLDNAVAVGYGAMGGVTTGVGQVAVGHSALCSLTSGAGNVAVGYQTLDLVTTGANNTAVGHQAGSNVATTVSGNTLVGFQSGTAVTTGGQNTLIGNGAGSAITTGANNTILGNYTGTTALANNVVLSDGAGNRRFQANASGAWSPDGTNFGTIGQFLASNGTVAAPSWCTLSLACIPCAAFVSCGDLLVGTGSATFTALPTGTNGQSLVVDTTCTATGGLKWITLPAQLCGYTCTATPFNTVVGSGAGAALTSLSVANTAFGYLALDAETTGDFNVAIGHNALTAQNGASGNTVIGGNAGAQVTSGSSNTFVGCSAGDVATTGSFNLAVGPNALGATTTGSCNVAIGSNSLLGVTTVNLLTAVGVNSLCGNTTGTQNTGVGWSVLSTNTTGSNNTALGYRAGVALSGSNNTIVGNNAGAALGVSSSNTLIGNSAGVNLTTGSCNTLVGGYGGTTTLSNNVVLSDGAGNIKLQVNENGAVGVGTTPTYGTAGQTLQSNGSAAVPTWVTPQTVSTTATKAVTNAIPVDLLSWASGVRLGDLTVMATDNSTNVVWANVTIASLSGIGSSVVVTQAGTFGTFAIIAGGSGETIVQFTPSATLATVNFVYKYTVSFGTQPTVL